MCLCEGNKETHPEVGSKGERWKQLGAAPGRDTDSTGVRAKVEASEARSDSNFTTATWSFMSTLWASS